MTIVPKVAGIIKTVQGAFAALNTTMLANPIFLIIAAIAALVAAFVYLWNNCEGFRQFWIDLWENIKGIVSSAIESIKAFFTGIIDFVKNNWQGLLLLLVNPFAGAFKLLYDNCEGFRVIINNLFEAIREIISNVFNGIKMTMSKISKAIKDGFKSAVDFIVELPAKALQWGKDIIMGIVNGIKSCIGKVGDAVKSVADKIKAFLPIILYKVDYSRKESFNALNGSIHDTLYVFP